ncbi:thioredoxin-like [Genypterus blacodes]|uniref:thioredoxin-like n=1 Tax=Genypterus blacodes TaxID=154954 RepID=UPI003F762851
MVKEVPNLKAFKAILKEAGGNLVAVDFTATWCGPCQRMTPVFIELESAPENKNVVFLKVDVDEADDIAAEYKIDSMPTFVFFKNGEEEERFSGASEQKLKDVVSARR